MKRVLAVAAVVATALTLASAPAQAADKPLFGYGQVVNACVMGANTYLSVPTNAGRLMLDVRNTQTTWFVTGKSYGEVLLSWAGTDLYDPDALTKVFTMCAS